MADDDSQTFAGFKMRIAAQEQVRIDNEREHTRSGKFKRSQKNMKADLKKQLVIEVDEDDHDSDVDRTKIISSTSMLSQSVQVSRRTRLAQPGFAMGESLPYGLMKKYQADDGKEEDEEDAELLETVGGIKADPLEGEKKPASRPSGRAQTRKLSCSCAIHKMTDVPHPAISNKSTHSFGPFAYVHLNVRWNA